MVKLHVEYVTPEYLYRNRRRFMRGLGLTLAGVGLAACGLATATPTPGGGPTGTPDGRADDRGNRLTPLESVAGFTNYYEFSLSKEASTRLARDLRTQPWSLAVDGLVAQPRTFRTEDLLALGVEERIYRMRCVEAWSMVIPWTGLPLARLLEQVAPQPEARYVRFETLLSPEQMPGQRDNSFDWPYSEALRLDEALHPLTLLATGLYGKPLPPQNGAPVRLVAPWKYGFKSIKAIVRITLVAEQPTTFLMAASPREYGFYANVNPDVPHPRWSQASERVIGSVGRRPTELFNGYDEVAPLYEGMDLRVNF